MTLQKRTPAPDGIDFTDTIHSDTYAAISSATASDLHGKSVFVTGAAKGVGRATAISFARAGAAQIAVADIAPFEGLEQELLQVAKSNDKAEPKILQLSLDITDRANVEAAAKQVAEAFGGRLDVLINNAGVLHPYIPMLESDPDRYWKTFKVNLGGTFNVTRYLLPLLLATESGLNTIVTVSSIGAMKAISGGSAYRTTKFALLRWTESLIEDYGEQGLLAYCIHPGALLTELGSGVPKEIHAKLTDKVELPADSMVWLCQVRREWLAGRYVSCTWDMPELMARKEEIVQGDKLRPRVTF